MVSALSGDIPEESESFPYQVLLLGDAMLEHETMDGCAPSVTFN